MPSCTHDPFLPADFEPEMIDTMEVDTMMIDTMTVDTTILELPCDSGLIYYLTDIAPILNTNCATAGCHDEESASSGIILNNYENTITTTNVVPFDLTNSMIYTTMIEDDPDLVMPPSGNLGNEAINKIALWILQGAENLECETEICDTSDVKYSGFIVDLMEQHCNVCHSTAAASGGIVTDNYASLETLANTGSLFGVINWNDGFSAMPQGQEKLDNCSIAKVKVWIDEGAQDN